MYCRSPSSTSSSYPAAPGLPLRGKIPYTVFMLHPSLPPTLNPPLPQPQGKSGGRNDEKVKKMYYTGPTVFFVWKIKGKSGTGLLLTWCPNVSERKAHKVLYLSGLGIPSLVFSANRSFFCEQKSEIANHSWSLFKKERQGSERRERFALGHTNGKNSEKLSKTWCKERRERFAHGSSFFKSNESELLTISL